MPSVRKLARLQREVDFLMNLLGQFLKQELPTLLDNDVRLQVVGQPERLLAAVADLLQETIAQTSHCRGPFSGPVLWRPR